MADKAIAGRTAEAIIAMRSAVEQGTDPIALIGALAMKLRTIAKASAVKAGTITQAQAKTNPWVLKNRHETAFGLDLGGTRAVHPHARLGGRTEQKPTGATPYTRWRGASN